jgi:peroxiredoxin
VSLVPRQRPAIGRATLVTLAALVALVALAGCSTGADAVDTEAGGADRFAGGSGTVSQYPADEREVAPDLSGTLVGGGRFALSDVRGDVVVLNWWGSWCAPCRAEADELEAVHRATRARGVRFVGVNIRDTESKAKAFDRTFGVTYPSIFDKPGRVALRLRAFPPNAIPATVVVDRKGRVAAVFRRPLLREDLTPVLDRLAAEPR